MFNSWYFSEEEPQLITKIFMGIYSFLNCFSVFKVMGTAFVHGIKTGKRFTNIIKTERLAVSPLL